jgi:hypothetical protein
VLTNPKMIVRIPRPQGERPEREGFGGVRRDGPRGPPRDGPGGGPGAYRPRTDGPPRADGRAPGGFGGRPGGAPGGLAGGGRGAPRPGGYGGGAMDAPTLPDAPSRRMAPPKKADAGKGAPDGRHTFVVAPAEPLPSPPPPVSLLIPLDTAFGGCPVDTASPWWLSWRRHTPCSVTLSGEKKKPLLKGGSDFRKKISIAEV